MSKRFPGTRPGGEGEVSAGAPRKTQGTPVEARTLPYTLVIRHGDSESLAFGDGCVC